MNTPIIKKALIIISFILVIFAFYYNYLSPDYSIHLFQDSVGIENPLRNYETRHGIKELVTRIEPIRIPWYHNQFNFTDYPLSKLFNWLRRTPELNITYHKYLTFFHLLIMMIGIFGQILGILMKIMI
jgi:hypothetical protein